MNASKISRRDVLRVLALGSGAALLAACGQPPAPAPTKPAESKPAEAKPAAAAPTSAPAAKPTEAAKPAEAAKSAAQPTAAPAAKAAASSGKLTIAQGVDPRSLWGNSSTAQQEINVSEQVTEKLIEFTADASDFEPRLATEWKQLDDTTLQMKLRQGVTFTNGEEFDAESARFSIETMLKAPAYVSFTSVIAGADVVDKHTINVKTKSPTLLHMPALAMGSFQYPPKHFQQLGQDEFGKKPIGTGPYTFMEWVKDSHVTLEANDSYWGGAPAMKTLTIRTIPEGAAKLAALETGEVDFTIDVPLDTVERIERNANLQLFSRPSNRLFYLVPSTLTDTPLKDPRVRRALWYAVDVEALIRGLFKGRAQPLAGQVLAPGYFGFDPGRQPTPYDPDKAKQLLAEAGHPNGFEITFKYPGGRFAQDKEVGQAVATQLAKVGVRTKQEVLESGTFLTQLSAKQLNDLYLGGSLPPPDAHFMYQQFESTFRYAYYSNPQFDELLQKGASTANREERAGIYKQVLDVFDQDPPYIPLYQPEDYYAGTKKLSGFAPRASQFLDLRAFKLG
jgi:peptide/nickel transport system substrate-binding protein